MSVGQQSAFMVRPAIALSTPYSTAHSFPQEVPLLVRVPRQRASIQGFALPSMCKRGKRESFSSTPEASHQSQQILTNPSRFSPAAAASHEPRQLLTSPGSFSPAPAASHQPKQLLASLSSFSPNLSSFSAVRCNSLGSSAMPLG